MELWKVQILWPRNQIVRAWTCQRTCGWWRHACIKTRFTWTHKASIPSGVRPGLQNNKTIKVSSNRLQLMPKTIWSSHCRKPNWSWKRSTITREPTSNNSKLSRSTSIFSSSKVSATIWTWDSNWLVSRITMWPVRTLPRWIPGRPWSPKPKQPEMLHHRSRQTKSASLKTRRSSSTRSPKSKRAASNRCRLTRTCSSEVTKLQDSLAIIRKKFL